MSQHDYVIDNANGAAVRLDMNNLFAAIQGNNSGATSPTSTKAFQWWMDTTANDMKVRNSGDTAWVSVFDLTGSVITPFRGTTLLGNAAEQAVGTAAPTNLPNVEDVQNQQGIYLLAGGSVNAFTLTLVPAIGSYVEGQRFVFKANLAITSTATLNVNSKGAGAILWPNGDALVIGDIIADQHVMVQRKASNFMMLGSKSIPSQAIAETGSQNVQMMTALRVLQSIVANPQDPPALSVDRAALKTTTGEISAGVTLVLLTGPGGEYGFWPNIKSSHSTSHFISVDVAQLNAIYGTTFLNRFVMQASTGRTVFMQQRYVQASPPYDLGDGQVASFIFALMNDATWEIEATYHAPDPPWANNGPTNIQPDRIDKKTGKMYKTIATLGVDKLKFMDKDFITEKEMEITARFKNSDMNLIPHPFQGNDLTGKTVVLLDPMSAIVERLECIKNCGGDAGEILYGNYLKIDNSELGRGRPPGVMSVSIKMK